MATKPMSIDFWRVVMPDGSKRSFEDVLKVASQLPDDESRAFTAGGAAMRLHAFASAPNRREGEMMRIRLDEVPVRASLAGGAEVFDFEDDEGVGEETAFLYHPGLRVLVLQRNRFGTSPSRFVSYMQQAGQQDGVITLEPVMEPSTMARFNSIRRARQFLVKVAGVDNPRTIKQQNPGASVKKMADLMSDLSSPDIEIYVSMGHRKGSLDTAAVKAVAKSLLRIDSATPADVKRLEISGRTAGDEEVVVDLLQDRMVETVELELDADRRLPYSTRRLALRGALAERESQLQSLFAQTDGS
jgi:hypothetical protein